MVNSTAAKNDTFEQKSYDDEHVIRTIQDGDKESFRILIDKYNLKIRNLIYLIINDNSIVDDLAQDIFIKVYESLPNFRFEASFYTWLYRITVNKCRDEIRRRKIRKIASLDFIFSKNGEVMDPVDEFGDLENRLLFNDAIAKLSESQREIIILKDINDMSYIEIAEILDCEVGTVKSRLSRARIELAKTIKRMIGENNAKAERKKTSFSLS
jgi:RNA polymerase sigma-70 factor, ECF subfamily